MIDWINIALRTLMCLAFLVLVLRPMLPEDFAKHLKYR